MHLTADDFSSTTMLLLLSSFDHSLCVIAYVMRKHGPTLLHVVCIINIEILVIHFSHDVRLG